MTCKFKDSFCKFDWFIHPTGNLNVPVTAQTATLLLDGQVLIAGDFNSGSYSYDAILFH
jgi:hypothetical protein